MKFDLIKYYQDNKDFLDKLTKDCYSQESCLNKLNSLLVKELSLCDDFVKTLLPDKSCYFKKENTYEFSPLVELSHLIFLTKILPPLIKEVVLLRKKGINFLSEENVDCANFFSIYFELKTNKAIRATHQLYVLLDEIEAIAENNFLKTDCYDGCLFPVKQHTMSLLPLLIPASLLEAVMENSLRVLEEESKKNISKKLEYLDAQGKKVEDFIFNDFSLILKNFAQEKGVFFTFNNFDPDALPKECKQKCFVFNEKTRMQIEEKSILYKEVEEIVNLIRKSLYIYFSIYNHISFCIEGRDVNWLYISQREILFLPTEITEKDDEEYLKNRILDLEVETSE